MDAERIAYSSAKSSEARNAFERRGFLSDGVGRNMGKMLRDWLAFVHRGLGGVVFLSCRVKESYRKISKKESNT